MHRSKLHHFVLLFLAFCLSVATALAQSAPPPPDAPEQSPTSPPQSIDSVYSSTSGQTRVRNALPPPPSAIDPAGPAVSLETNEPLFFLAAALNVCGYDIGLKDSAPVRIAVRNEMNQALEESAAARDARDQLCLFIHRRDAGDEDRNVSQYISLAVYLTPPPELSPSAESQDMPPDSTGVVGVLPYLRKFANAINLHLIWLRHRPDYEDITNAIHDPMTRMVLETNIYLKQPASTYEGRRFLVLLEPMLSPTLTNARVYGADYIVVTSPSATPPPVPTARTTYAVHLDEIRHTYLHYQIEPLIYTRAGSLERMVGFLTIVRNAPIDFSFRSDIVAFFTECLIRAIETRLMDTGIPHPPPPPANSPRYIFDKYAIDVDAWDHQTEAFRRAKIDRDVHTGFVLAQYFYEQISRFEKSPDSLNDAMGEIVYGMPVDRELSVAKHVVFSAYGSSDVLQHVPRQLTGLDLADLDMIKGKNDDAEEIAQKVLDSKPAPEDAARANFILGRIDILERETEDAIAAFQQTVKLSQDPRTLAWAHIYLGRIYDINTTPDKNLRDQALAEYRAALAVRDSQPDTKTAAEAGIKQPFVLPKSAMRDSDDDATLDPSGKAEKENYKPDPPSGK